MPAESRERPALQAARAALAEHHRHIGRLVQRLPELCAPGEGEDRRTLARELARHLDDALRAHMRHEEQSLFPAILRAAESPARQAQAFEAVSSLLVQHCELIETWRGLCACLEAAGKGVAGPAPREALERFAAQCARHMADEDRAVADLLGLLDEACLRRLEEAQPVRRPPVPPAIP